MTQKRSILSADALAEQMLLTGSCQLGAEQQSGLRGSEPGPGEKGHPLRGLSVDYIADAFVREVQAADLPANSVVYVIEPKVIRPKGTAVCCPRDGKEGAAYVDCVESGPGKAGDSNLMLSYGWGYEWSAIASTLKGVQAAIAFTRFMLSLVTVGFCNRSGRCQASSYVWICW